MLKQLYFNNFLFFPELFLLLIIPLFFLFFIIKFVYLNLKSNLNLINYFLILLLIIYLILIIKNLNSISFGFNNFINTNLSLNNFKIIIIFILIYLNFFSLNSLKNLNLYHYEFYILILISFLGSIIAISSGNFLSFIFGIELQSLTIYILISIKKNSILTLESSIKYFLISSISSIITFIGICFILIYYNTLNFFELSLLNANINNNLFWLITLIFLFAIILFKLAIFPFQFWSPDIYQTCETTIVLFLATISKLTIFIIILKFLLINTLFINFFFFNYFLLFFIIITIIIGTFRGLIQINIKRILAYSSMIHISFMLIILIFFNINNLNLNNIIIFKILSLNLSERIKVSIFTVAIFYILIYIILNLIFFSILIILKKIKFNNNYKEIKNISDLNNLSINHPVLSFILLINLLSLCGLPPFLGFFNKYFILIQLININHYILSFFILILSIISTFYYFKVIKSIYYIKNYNLSIKLKNLSFKLNFNYKINFFYYSKNLFILIFFLSLINLFGIIFYYIIYYYSFFIALNLNLNNII